MVTEAASARPVAVSGVVEFSTEFQFVKFSTHKHLLLLLLLLLLVVVVVVSVSSLVSLSFVRPQRQLFTVHVVCCRCSAQQPMVESRSLKVEATFPTGLLCLCFGVPVVLPPVLCPDLSVAPNCVPVGFVQSIFFS